MLTQCPGNVFQAAAEALLAAILPVWKLPRAGRSRYTARPCLP